MSTNLQRYQIGRIINHAEYTGAKVRFIRRMRGTRAIIVETIDYHDRITYRSRVHIQPEQFEPVNETQ